MKNPIESGKLKKELSPKEKKIAMSLESFRYLEPKDKVFLVLVWRGLKTASAVSFQAGAPEKTLLDLQERVEKAGLLFKKTDHIITEEMGKEEARGLRPGKVCFVAKDEKDLDLISKLWFGDHDKDPEVYKEIGRMSGFPQTAINVYDKFTRLPDPEKDKTRVDLTVSEREKRNLLLKTEPRLIPFSFLFYMSKENWKSELETVRRWAEEIKLVTPALYGEFTNLFERSASLDIKK